MGGRSHAVLHVACPPSVRFGWSTFEIVYRFRPKCTAWSIVARRSCVSFASGPITCKSVTVGQVRLVPAAPERARRGSRSSPAQGEQSAARGPEAGARGPRGGGRDAA